MEKEKMLELIRARADEVRGVYRAMVLEDTDRFAFEIAQQANSSESERKGAYKVAGPTIVQLCLDIYPDVNWDSKFEDCN